MTTEEVIEELEALTAILDEGTVEIVNNESDRPKEISIKITPLTASEQEKQYVSLTLVITLPIAYPNAPPTLGIRNPRGLEDSAIGGLLDEMNTRCDEYVGCPVLFELIEMSREFLTSRNVPVVRCIICLSNIKEEDQFMKTECLHFFHKHCLGRYITNMQETHAEQIAEAQGQNSNNSVKDFKVTCPVCRETIGESRYNLADLLQSIPPISEQEEPKSYTISDDVRKMQKMMQKLYTQQKEKGGIIDLEAEEKKFLVVTNTGNEDEEKFTELSPTDYQLGEMPRENRFLSSINSRMLQMIRDFIVPKYHHQSPLKRCPIPVKALRRNSIVIRTITKDMSNMAGREEEENQEDIINTASHLLRTLMNVPVAMPIGRTIILIVASLTTNRRKENLELYDIGISCGIGLTFGSCSKGSHIRYSRQFVRV